MGLRGAHGGAACRVAPAITHELAQHRLVKQVDYILFARADVSLEPNPEEVQAVRYVDQATLRAMMAPESGMRWSPWFRRAPSACVATLVCYLETQGQCVSIIPSLARTLRLELSRAHQTSQLLHAHEPSLFGAGSSSSTSWTAGGRTWIARWALMTLWMWLESTSSSAEACCGFLREPRSGVRENAVVCSGDVSYASGMVSF